MRLKLLPTYGFRDHPDAFSAGVVGENKRKTKGDVTILGKDAGDHSDPDSLHGNLVTRQDGTAAVEACEWRFNPRARC